MEMKIDSQRYFEDFQTNNSRTNVSFDHGTLWPTDFQI